ncbi:RND family efflux transporter MFP subunit [Fictibacillus macauensis ZFHKF-1]|uniref:RND family efflux transporter MFP subunit n=1 Tax=Fictibacillus macauensis ZFHKF-1 TaxID=1196324 RepID=I8UCN9_9BACL|nr:efflux RND transporter periplasmic adaptor subunit [Fictibacillus macauensis]EIT84543.1 RND family efflux transporter MFP subunit [Fictibacillus macauensis ZFHKF-1]
MTRKRIFILIIAVSLLLIILNTWVYSNRSSAFLDAPTVELVAAKTADLKKASDAMGQTTRAEDETYYADSKRGYVKEIKVKVGDDVSAGTVLFTYENEALNKEIREVEQKKKENENKVTYYKDLQTKLGTDGTETTTSTATTSTVANQDNKPKVGQTPKAASEPKKEKKKQENFNEKERAKAELQQKLAEANVSAYDEQLKKLQSDKEGLEVKSKGTGKVKEAVSGTPASGQPVVEISSDALLQVKAFVKEEDVAFLKEGEEVTVTSEARDEEVVKGTIAQIQEGKRGIFPVTIKLSGQSSLKVGQKVAVHFKLLLKKDGLLLPSEAIVHKGDDTFVWIVQKGYLKTISIKAGKPYGSWIEVRKGLKAGDTVVTQPTSYLTENTKVVVTNEQVRKKPEKTPAKQSIVPKKEQTVR